MNKKIVGISDMAVSKDGQELLITYSLGSCIGIAIWDPVVKVGGMLHYMLPDSRLDKERAERTPFMFATTGIPRLFKEVYKYGGNKNRIIVKVAGGAQLMDTSGVFNIGKRNYHIMQKIFQKNLIKVSKEEVGGSVNRTLSLAVGTGITTLKVPGRGEFEL